MAERMRRLSVLVLPLVAIGTIALAALQPAASSRDMAETRRDYDKAVSQRPEEPELPLPRDYWVTVADGPDGGTYQDLTMPAGFFGPDCEQFDGRVYFIGTPLDRAVTANVDTILERSGDPVVGDDPVGTVGTVDLELKELSLISREPITIICGGEPEFWTVRVGLSPTVPSMGWLTASKTDPNGGTFNSTVFVQPLLTFSRWVDPDKAQWQVTDPGEVLVWDTARHSEPFALIAEDVPFAHEVPEAMRFHPDTLGNRAPPRSEFITGIEILVLDPDRPRPPPGCTTHQGPGHHHTACPPVGACCEGSSCSITTEDACAAAYQGDGTGCDPNPCVVFDCFESTAQVTVTLNVDDEACDLADTIFLTSADVAPATVARGATIETGVPLNTEMIRLLLRGDDLALGPVIVRERADKNSTGSIDDMVAGPGGGIESGDSNFGVFVRIEIPDLSLALDTADVPIPLGALGITSLPPVGSPYLPPPDSPPVPLYIACGGEQVGWLCHSEHVPTQEVSCEPEGEPGACCANTTCTEMTCSVTTQAECPGDFQGEGEPCDPNPCPEIDLEIHKPKVIDPAEPAIPDAEELTKGAQTFVNLDNDDQDWLFDTMDLFEDGNVPGEDEMTLLKLKVKPTDLAGTVTLSATAGGADIKVWDSASKVTEVTLPKTYTVPGAFPDIEGAWRVKKVWVEGRSPHTAQRQTKLKMELNKPATNNPDEVALTIIGIDKIEWIGKGNSRNDDNALDADPNWPGEVNPGSLRVFPGARVVGGAVEGNPRDKVDVKVTLTVDPVEAVKIYFDSFDVDDPTTATDPLDDVAGDEASPEDNRGTMPDESGQFVKADGSNDETGGLKEHEFPDKEETFLFRTTMQPGDNFRIVGNGDKDFLPDLENKDSDYAGNNNDKQRIVNKHVIGTAAQKEVREVAHYASDKVLTVWRFLHMEVDSMGDVLNNFQEGNITGLNTGNSATANRATLSTSPRDGSADLDSAPPGDGRFDQGTLRVATTHNIAPLDGNGQNDIRRAAGMNVCAVALPFYAEDDDLILPEAMGGTVTAIIGGSLVLTLNVAWSDEVPIDWPDFVDGTIDIDGGPEMDITAVNAGASQLTVSGLLVPYHLTDDDAFALPHVPDAGLMNALYAPAYIVSVNDGGGNASNNTTNVNPVINLSANTNGALKALMDVDSDDNRSDRFWIAYILSGYQKTTTGDYDPDGTTTSEFGPHGTTPGGEPRLGCAIWQESVDDFIRQAALPGQPAPFAAWQNQRQLRERRVLVHEVAHQFNIGHTGGIMNNGWANDESFDANGDPQFTDAQVDIMRRRVKSPGK